MGDYIMTTHLLSNGPTIWNLVDEINQLIFTCAIDSDEKCTFELADNNICIFKRYETASRRGFEYRVLLDNITSLTTGPNFDTEPEDDLDDDLDLLDTLVPDITISEESCVYINCNEGDLIQTVMFVEDQEPDWDGDYGYAGGTIDSLTIAFCTNRDQAAEIAIKFNALLQLAKKRPKTFAILPSHWKGT